MTAPAEVDPAGSGSGLPPPEGGSGGPSHSGSGELPEDDLSTGLYLSLVRALRWLRRTGPTDIGHGGLSAMATLLGAGPMRSGQLAEREGVAASTMSRIIDSLVGDALVERVPDPDDRRALLIRLTPTGTASVEQARATRAGALRARVAQLPADEQEALRAALPALAHLVGS